MIYRKRLIFLTALITIVVSIFYINVKTKGPIDFNNLTSSIIQGFKPLKVIEDKSVIEYDGIKFVVKMPIVNYENKDVERYINTYIRKNISQFINTKKQQKDISSNNKDLVININYHIAFEDKNVLNIIIYKDINIKGKKYERIKDSYVFDLKTGQRIYIDNFLKNNKDYDYVLKNYVLNKIDRKNLKIDKEKIQINKHTNYYITDEGLAIYFNPYQISDRKEIYEFKIPVTAFNKKIKTLDTNPIVAQIDTQTITKNTEYINSIINIPMIIIKNKEIEKSINEKIKNDIMKSYSSVEEDAKSYLSNTPKEYTKPFIYNVNFDVKKNSDNMLSILIKYYQESGGAHGFYENKSYNIYIEDGKILSLRDLFKESSDYVNVINEIIREKIKEGQDGAYSFKSISNNQKFYIEDDKLVIYFDLYEIAPFAAGIPEFKIDINNISHILNEKYIDIFK
ncbi:MAG: DUF3298 domain-containing protein [Paeniclostridium sordellii]|uniref:DUF3298 domain-containing protein n=1 Tax=Paeniclostridium hominis TaxID=2764329 RepID=A0ABR7K589_9FIRM|nr:MULTISPECIES: DUF3298 domain-containing protein [Paeniclostridium]MBC6004273.1 DUF3298 domain-containing protein [Paeniclostridium hominis]MDU2591943.1 DUF3298 domain-containing protein [Paeniclostridium sordellii]